MNEFIKSVAKDKLKQYGPKKFITAILTGVASASIGVTLVSIIFPDKSISDKECDELISKFIPCKETEVKSVEQKEEVKENENNEK